MSGTIMHPSPADLDGYGCDAAFWCHLRDIGVQMVRAGGSKDATPLRAFGHQRNAALRRRGIEWNLTLPAWWAIWNDSGHWHERGVGRGYMMCRKGDKGAYEVGNVYIGPGVENLSAAAKKSDLPIGVARMAKGGSRPYRAYCNIAGKQRHLGTFATVAEAEAAYLAARNFDVALKAVPARRAA